MGWWPQNQSTWEPLENLSNVLYMVSEYENNLAEIQQNNVQNEEASETQNKIMVKKRGRPLIERDSKIGTNGLTKRRGSSSSRNGRMDEEDEIEIVNVESLGKIECDIPKQIVSAKLQGDEVLCLIKWNKRFDRSRPTNSYISNRILKKKYPDLLIEYYESKLRSDRR